MDDNLPARVGRFGAEDDADRVGERDADRPDDQREEEQHHGGHGEADQHQYRPARELACRRGVPPARGPGVEGRRAGQERRHARGTGR